METFTIVCFGVMIALFIILLAANVVIYFLTRRVDKGTTFVLTIPMYQKITDLAKQWKVSESEALRRIFGVGSVVLDEIFEGNVFKIKVKATGEEHDMSLGDWEL